MEQTRPPWGFGERQSASSNRGPPTTSPSDWTHSTSLTSVPRRLLEVHVALQPPHSPVNQTPQAREPGGRLPRQSPLLRRQVTSRTCTALDPDRKQVPQGPASHSSSFPWMELSPM